MGGMAHSKSPALGSPTNLEKLKMTQ